MATINYGFTFTPVGTANEVVTAVPDITLPSPTGNYTVENDTEGSAATFSKSMSVSIIALTIYNPINTFKNGVYHVFGSHVSGPDTYDGDGYFVVIVDLENDIAAYPTTTLMDQNMHAYFDLILLDIANALLLPNYGTVSAAIIDGQNALTATTNTSLLLNASALTSATNIRVTVSPTSAFGTAFIVWANLLTNTLDGETKDFSAQTYAVSASNTIINVTNSGMYPTRFADGVYLTELDVLDFSPGGTIFSSESRCLVTTETDLGIALYQANYDPTNATQVANLATLLSLQALVLSEYAANDYAGANQAIEDIYAILEQGINWPGLAIELTDKSNFTLEFASLPSGLYTDQTGVLTNTLNGEEYSFTSEEFPEDDTDTVLVLNSETLEAGDEYADGVYQAAVQFNTDGVVFNSIVYGFVLTNIYCGFDKIVAKATTCKYSESLQMKVSVSIKQIINSFERGDYVTANKLIQDTTQMLNSTGCGCGCG
jgi:hypothetical protein